LTVSRTSPAADGAAATAEAPAGNSHALRSDTLLQGRSYVSIVHNGETYQLRATKLGKLILTK
jgi:hemin uptake protein HemP